MDDDSEADRSSINGKKNRFYQEGHNLRSIYGAAGYVFLRFFLLISAKWRSEYKFYKRKEWFVQYG